MVLKKHPFIKIGLFLILFAVGFVGINSAANVMSGAGVIAAPSGNGQQNFTPGQGNRPSGMTNQPPAGQFAAHNGNRGMAFPHGGAGGPGGIGKGSSSAGTACASPLLIYAAIFLGLAAVAYYYFIYKKRKMDPGKAKLIIESLLCAGLLLRIYAATLMTGHPYDINIFKNWAAAAANNLFQVYSTAGSNDYPPLYMYILFLIGKIGSIQVLSPYYMLLLKLPSIMADIAASYLVYKLARKHLSLELSILLAAFYIFNPAVFINSTFWGQVDSFFTLIVIGAVLALSEIRIGLSSVLFMAAVLMKPQGIIFLPVLFFELVRQKKLTYFIKAAVYALGTAVIIVLPFSLSNGDMLWIFKLFARTIGEYPYASVNAFNLFGLVGANFKYYSADWIVLSYHTWGMIFIVLVTAFSWLIYIKGNRSAMAPAAALFQIAGVFTLATSMHERYLFPAAALAILTFIYLRDKRLLLLVVGFSTTIYINTHVVLFATLQGINSASYSPVLITTSLLNVLLLTYLGKVLFDIASTPPIPESAAGLAINQ